MANELITFNAGYPTKSEAAPAGGTRDVPDFGGVTIQRHFSHDESATEIKALMERSDIPSLPSGWTEKL